MKMVLNKLLCLAFLLASPWSITSMAQVSSGANPDIVLIDSFDDISSVQPAKHQNSVVAVRYGSAVGDKLGGLFMYNPSSTETVDGVNVFVPVSGVGRWVRVDGAAYASGSLTADRLVVTDASGVSTTVSGLVYDNATGNTGVGAASPGQVFEVRKDQAGTTAIRVNNDNASGFSGVELYDGATIASKLIWQNAGHLQLSTEIAGRDILLRPNGTTAMTILESSGNVGVKPENIFMGAATLNTNRMIHINKVFDSAPNPAYAMHATIQQDGAISTAGINMKVVRGGSSDADHVVAFQSDVAHGGTGMLNHVYGNYNVRSFTGGGIAKNSYGAYYATPSISGGTQLTNNFGLYFEDQRVGISTNKVIHSEGGNVVFKNASLGLNTDAPAQVLDVAAGKIAVSDGQNIGDRDGNTGMFVSSDSWYVQTAGSTRTQVNSSGTLLQTGDIQVKGQNEVQFADADSSNYVSFKSASVVASDLTWVLPTTWGTQGSVLTNDGAGNLSWDHVHLAGSWTPSLQFGGASVGMTYTTQEGRYFRAGKIVYVRGTIVLSAKGSSTGTATIAGLADAGDNTPGNDMAISIGRASNMASLTSSISATVTDSGTTVNLYDWGASGVAVLDDTNFTDTTTITISGTYILP